MFRRQLVIGHTALLFVTILTGAVAIIALGVTSSRLERVGHELAANVIAVQRLQFQAEQVVATSRGYLLTGDPETLVRFGDAVARVEGSLVTLRRQHAELGDDASRVEEATRTYVAAARNAAERRSETDDPRAVVPYFEQTLAPARERFDAAITGFAKREQDAFEHASHHARDFADRMRDLVAATTVLAIMLGVALAWLSMRRLGSQYARACAATSEAVRAVEARDELLAIVSHDLRSPLTAISIGTTLLDAELAGGAAHKQVATIRRASEHMAHLISELLDVAKLEAGKLELHTEPCTVDALLEAVGALFTARAGQAEIELTIEPTRAGSITADRERIVQVLSNLVGNALKFTPPGGRVSVAAQREADAVRIAVTDTGPGIPESDVSHLFERYWQGRRRGRGSLGLGLYICKQIVEAHGGRIGVETQAGKGSTFWVELRGSAPTR
jgi:signal transduction histidine kinase